MWKSENPLKTEWKYTLSKSCLSDSFFRMKFTLKKSEKLTLEKSESELSAFHKNSLFIRSFRCLFRIENITVVHNGDFCVLQL